MALIITAFDYYLLAAPTDGQTDAFNTAQLAVKRVADWASASVMRNACQEFFAVLSDR